MANSASPQASTVKAILIGLAAILLIIVALQNVSVITVKILFWTIPMSKILVILIAALIGFVIGLLCQSPLKPKRK